MKTWFGQASTSGDQPEFLKSLRGAKYILALVALGLALCPGMLGGFASAQTTPPAVSVLTSHNDNTRQGQNTNEIYLTPAAVNTTNFGKLFFQPTNGGIFAQLLYAQGVVVNGKSHNVVYVGDYGDDLFAFDADTNGGTNASALWRVSLLTNTTPAGTYTSQFGVQGTPVIDPSTSTMYLVSSELHGTTPIFRFHALDTRTGVEKFGGPVTIAGSVTPATGTGSTNGTLTFDPAYERQRPGLLLQQGVVYAAFGSTNDTGPWHGWIFSFNAATLQPIGTFCTSADGSGGGVWMSGRVWLAR